MTAELWLEKPCEHGKTSEHLRATCLDLHPNDRPRSHFKQCWCPGGSRVRLDPQKVVFTIPNDMWGTDDEYTVQDVIDALEEEEESRPPDAWVCPRCGTWEMEGEKFPNCSECGMAYRKPALDQEEE